MPLSLGRKDGESVVITHPDGTVVTIRVVLGHGQGQKKVRLLIEAPDYVRVDRAEVDQIRRDRYGDDDAAKT